MPTAVLPQLAVQIDPELRKAIRLAAIQLDVSTKELVLRWMREGLARDGQSTGD